MDNALNYVVLIIHLCLFLLKLPLYHHYSCGLYCDYTPDSNELNAIVYHSP